jgi:hypothetical protein
LEAAEAMGEAGPVHKGGEDPCECDWCDAKRTFDACVAKVREVAGE